MSESNIVPLGTPDMTAELWTREETAAYLRVTVGTLANWGTAKYGPRSARIGKRVRYRRDEVLAFVEASFEEAA